MGLRKKLFRNSQTTKRIVLVVFASMVLLACYSVVSSYFMYCDQTLSRLDAIAKTLSTQVDGDLHEKLTNTLNVNSNIDSIKNNELYQRIHLQLKQAQLKNNLKSEISTLIYNVSLNQFFYVTNSTETPYYLDPYTQNQTSFLKLYHTGGTIPEYSDEFGTWLTAIHPVLNSHGKVVAIIEVDERYDDFLDVIDGVLYKKIAIALIIFLIVAFVLLRYLRIILLREEELKKEIEQASAIINQHNEDMLDSIHYAKKIQTAILPPLENLNNTIPNSFVYYQPKDIVSGDFYFFKDVIPGEKYIIASCDCTGHGVPGALMSMIGINFLDHIISKDFYSPAEILSKLNYSVINTLKQGTQKSESKDGMDVSLCLVDKLNNTVTYSGANRPLYIVEDSINCIEIKADKRSIGGFDNVSFQFTEHVIKIKPQQNFYLFSDGYADQFGGTKDKKFGSKQFKNLLLSIQNLPMKEQGKIIEASLIAWKSSNSQTDDVLVIGFEVL